ncbi:MAG: 3-hydroxybutyrate oligomer hydrolase family protein [Burkholderiales bacterium]|nr:3-hydroxybutyrate oligomer hydrolase family protein [Burkholderiales bacterium]
MSRQVRHHALAASTAALLLAGCGGGGSSTPLNTLPAGIAELSRTGYTATAPGTGTTAATQDLLTGGLGKTGLGMAAAPAYADPLNPTALELRRNALHSNYRGIMDASAGSGYGTLYGPNIDLAGGNTLGEGLIPGVEYMARLDDGTGRKNVGVAIQIPSTFDPQNPCVVAGPSSGSRGVYGSIGSTSEWGLKRGCAVALTDAGKGVGLYDLMDDTVTRMDGTRATRSAAGVLANFAAAVSDAARATFNAAFPNRLAVRHAHSQLNPEKDWGSDTLASVQYALYVLNQEHAPLSGDGATRTVRFNAANTLVIAGSVSNGGAAVLQAAEQDTGGLIDGVVATEPSAQPRSTAGYGVQQGGAAVSKYGQPLIDYFTVANLYQPCAAQAPAVAMAESNYFNFMTFAAMNARGANRCAALAAKGLVTGADTAAQAADALQKLRDYGFQSEHDFMHNAHYGLGNAPIIGMMYTNALGRFSVLDNLCGMSAAQVNATGDVIPVVAATKAASFAAGNGTVNGVPAAVVYNNSVGGAKGWQFAVSPSSGTADFALDAALCQRSLVTGTDAVTGAALTTTSVPTKAQSDAVRAGIAEVQLGGNLRGKPTLLVAGRSDALVLLNHNSRAYAAFNRATEGASSKVSYVEVTNAQHFDTFLSLPGWDTRFVPLHYYFNQAMNAMYANLKSGTALPPSQVVRATPRGGVPGAAPAITVANLPSIVAAPAAGNQIGFSGTSINVPN